MCTLTWARPASDSPGSGIDSPGSGYELFFNRDELKTRRPALPPVRRETNGVAWIAAIDADAGGTWLGVNERGVSVALLNGWRGRDLARSDATSRGLLVTSLLDAAGTRDVAARLEGRDLTEFRSFNLLSFDPEPAGDAPGVLRAEWDGERLFIERLGDDRQPISSSSRDPQGAERNRRAVWSRLTQDGLPGPAELEAFHASHDPEPGAWSPCMHRDDAETVSFTRIRVDERAVELSYRAGASCRGGEPVRLRLERAAAPGPAPSLETPGAGAARP